MLLTVQQFAAACGPAVSEGMVRFWIRRGKIAVSQLGERSRYLIDDSQIPRNVTRGGRETKAERKARCEKARAAIAAM